MCESNKKKAKTEYFVNLNTKIVYDNKRFWKTMKPLFSDKKCKNQKIVLVENDEIIKDSLQNCRNYDLLFCQHCQKFGDLCIRYRKIP